MQASRSAPLHTASKIMKLRKRGTIQASSRTDRIVSTILSGPDSSPERSHAITPRAANGGVIGSTGAVRT